MHMKPDLRWETEAQSLDIAHGTLEASCSWHSKANELLETNQRWQGLAKLASRWPSGD